MVREVEQAHETVNEVLIGLPNYSARKPSTLGLVHRRFALSRSRGL
jgi:hypothetical protein